MTRERWLFGTRLPDLYLSITGNNKFKHSKNFQGDVVKNGGVAFVMACAEAIGVDPTNPDNIVVHFRNCNKKNQ